MGWGKILGSAVAGFLVGGPVGAIIAGAAGAGVSAATDNDVDEERAKEQRKIARAHRELEEQNEKRQQSVIEQERKRVERQAEALKSAEKVSETIENYDKTLHNDAEHAQLIVAFMAIGLASANADGEASPAELAELKTFLKDINQGHNELPEKVLLKMRKFKANPPTMKQAVAEVKKVPNYDPAMFQKLIELIIKSDGKVTEEEESLLKEWYSLLAADTEKGIKKRSSRTTASDQKAPPSKRTKKTTTTSKKTVPLHKIASTFNNVGTPFLGIIKID